jgi:uncharacterized protein (DUF1499 family)
MGRPLHIVLALAIFGPASALPDPTAERLPACPASPNCVSSDADGKNHGIAAFALALPPAEAWREARRVVAALPRTRIVAESDTVLRAECSSAVFAFVDDLELQLRPAQGIIAVRSAARIGWSDFGVNRRRVEEIRAALIRAGALR